jgi:hypothetical protein
MCSTNFGPVKTILHRLFHIHIKPSIPINILAPLSDWSSLVWDMLNRVINLVDRLDVPFFKTNTAKPGEPKIESCWDLSLKWDRLFGWIEKG